MKSSSIIFAGILFIASSAVFAQGAPKAGAPSPATPPAAAPAPAPPPPPAAPAPTDAQIAHMVVTANQVDIDAGKLAQSKGSSKDVKAFGKQMVTDHTAVNKQASALAKKLKLTPQDNPTSQAVKAGGAQNIKKLNGLKGKAFDKAYIDHEISYHQDVIDALDKLLIPNAKNPELKALIIKVRPAFVAHLEKAKKIQSTLKS